MKENKLDRELREKDEQSVRDMEEGFPGVLLDERPQEAKDKDYRFEEVVASAAPVNWIEKDPSKWRKFPIFDQNGSGSCVAQTGRKMLGVYTWLKTGQFIPLSASHIYQRRSNRPAAGMAGEDVFKVMQKGTTLEQIAPSEKLSDSEMDAIQVNEFSAKIGETFKIGQYLSITNTGDIDLVASIIQQTGKAVMVWFYFNANEWTSHPAVLDRTLNPYAAKTLRHSVAAVDFCLINGKKALIVDESWGGAYTANGGQRAISEEFFKARNFFGGHFMNFAFEDKTAEPATGKPIHTFSRDLEFSAEYRTDADVVALQNCLKWEGVFPANSDSTGYFGAITRKAVEAFQVKHGITTPAGAGYGRVGPATRAKLNALYSK